MGAADPTLVNTGLINAGLLNATRSIRQAIEPIHMSVYFAAEPG